MHKIISFSHITICVFSKKIFLRIPPLCVPVHFFFLSFLLLELEGRLFLLVAPDLVLGDGFFSRIASRFREVRSPCPTSDDLEMPSGTALLPLGLPIVPLVRAQRSKQCGLGRDQEVIFSVKRNDFGEKRKNGVVRVRFNDKAIVKCCLLKMLYGQYSYDVTVRIA